MQVPCASLHDVIYYLMEKTDKVLTPLNMEGPYERNISTCKHPFVKISLYSLLFSISSLSFLFFFLFHYFFLLT